MGDTKRGVRFPALTRSLAMFLLAELTLLTLVCGILGAQPAAQMGTISGQVVSKETGEPVPRGWVIATPVRTSAMVHRSLGGRIGSDGSFRIHGVPLGQYVLTARAPGFQNSDESGEPHSRRVVEVLAGGQRWQNGGGSDMVLLLRRTAVISGSVRDEDGFPVERANVSVFAVSKDGSRARRNAGGAGTTTDDRGQYRIGGLVAGSYFVRVQRHDAHQMVNVEDRSAPDAVYSLGARINSAYHPGATGPEQAAVVQLAPGEERYGVDIAFPAVMGYPVSGTVLNPDGSPGYGAHVQILRGNARFPWAFDSSHAGVLQDGTFRSPPLPPGEYLLGVARSTRERPREPLFAQATVQLGGGPVEGVLLQLAEPLRISGSVSMPRTGRGAPEPSGRAAMPVIALVPDNPGGGMTQGQGALRAQVLEDGRFELHAVRPGDYRLEANVYNSDWYVSEAALGGHDLLRGPATIDSGASGLSMRVVFREGAAKIQGTVPPPDGSGNQTCFLRLYPLDDRSGSSPNLRQSYCNQEGAFSIGAVAPGRHKLFLFTIEEMQEGDLEALAADRWDTTPTISVQERETKEIQLEWP